MDCLCDRRRGIRCSLHAMRDAGVTFEEQAAWYDLAEEQEPARFEPDSEHFCEVSPTFAAMHLIGRDDMRVTFTPDGDALVAFPPVGDTGLWRQEQPVPAGLLNRDAPVHSPRWTRYEWRLIDDIGRAERRERQRKAGLANLAKARAAKAAKAVDARQAASDATKAKIGYLPID